jgi:ABC-type nitrate/sulfonate/bicarbonate transport system substrate-binding protein
MTMATTARKTVRIGPSHYHVGHVVPAMIAREMIYFDEEGFAPYDIHFGGLIPAMVEKIALRRAMTEKGVDIVPDVKPTAVFNLASKGEDVFIVGCWRNRQNFRFFGSRGIKDLAGLKGKRIGIRDFGGIGQTVLKLHLQRAGLDPDKDVVYVRGARFHPHENPEAALRSGEIDCMHLQDFDPRCAALESEGYPVLLESRKVYPAGRPDRVIIATRRMVEKDGDLLTAYLRATIRAYWFLTDYERNRPYAEALVRRLRKACLDEEEAGRSGVEGGGRLVLPYDGAPGIAGLKEMSTEAKETGDLDPSFDLSSILRLEFVQQAFRELEARAELKEIRERVKAIYQGREAAA